MAKDKCPFSKNLDCGDCRLFRRGMRLVGIEKRQEKVETCVLHVMADNIEAEHKAVLSLQAEMGETKNANIFQALAILTDQAGAKEELRKMIVKAFKTDKLLGQ